MKCNSINFKSFFFKTEGVCRSGGSCQSRVWPAHVGAAYSACWSEGGGGGGNRSGLGVSRIVRIQYRPQIGGEGASFSRSPDLPGPSRDGFVGAASPADTGNWNRKGTTLGDKFTRFRMTKQQGQRRCTLFVLMNLLILTDILYVDSCISKQTRGVLHHT